MLRLRLLPVIAGLLALMGAGLPLSAQGTETYTGYMGNDVPDDYYDFALVAGEGVIITAETTTGDLDPYLVLLNPEGEQIDINDDADATTLNARLLFVAQKAGMYTVGVTNISGTSGDYLLTIRRVDSSAVYAEFDAMRPALSGPPAVVETDTFRVHYTTEGADATDPAFALEVAAALDAVYDAQVIEMGWPPPPSDGSIGGDGRYDVYLRELDTPDLAEYGSAMPEMAVGDNPLTPNRETLAVTSYITLDNDYRFDGVDDPLRVMQATVAHEFHHAIQFGYDWADDNWFYEATSSYMETVTLPGVEEATPYVRDVFTYPEVCLGAEASADPTGGGLMYGHWLFMEALVDDFGPQVLLDLWANIGSMEGWRSLEAALNTYSANVSDTVLRYHVRNLALDYLLAADFGATVWIEAVIDAPGAWTYSGQGVQELAANYFELALTPDQYTLRLLDGADSTRSAGLALWAVGIKGQEAAAYPLGRGGTLDTSGWDYGYLVVFDPTYDDDLNDCTYADYSIEMTPGGATTPVEPAFTLDAANFTPPQ